jgi:signal transduction histidine kinase
MGMMREPTGPPAFLVVGIDMDKSLSAYKGFRQNAVFQAVYILAAALFTWGFALNFLSRRDQARKAVSLERFQAKLLDNLPDGLLTLDTENVITSANPAALAILGREAGSLVGRPAAVLPSDVAESITGYDGSVPVWRRVAMEGAHLEILALPFSDDAENSSLVIIRDRTRLRGLEQSLANAEKLAAIGALAAGVAHEIRNPLSSLRGFAQYFVKKLSGRQPEEEYAKTMVREADRLNRVIAGLLFLSRPRSTEPTEVDLGAVVGEMAQLLRFDLEQKNLRLETEIAASTVHADADALKQILLNLLLNSLDAVPVGGEPLVVASGREADGVWIEVRDKGCGMNAEQREHAFEAFFTAKENGTGLGLALAQRAMQDHEGSAGIVSAPGAGCVVRLFFPDADKTSRMQ